MPAGVFEQAMARLALVTAAVTLAVALSAAPALARPGDVDPTFGTAGELMLPDDLRELRGAAALTDGQVLVAAEGYQGVLIRVDEHGRLDRTFSGDGLSELPLAWTSAPILQPGGRVILAGRVAGAQTEAGVVRIGPDGELDPSFGSNGVARIENAPQGFSYSTAFGQAGGGVVVAGTVVPDYTRARAALTRFDARGVQDRGFGENGWVVTEVPESSMLVTAGVEDPAGRLVVAGEAARSNTYGRPGPPEFRWTLLRYLSDGTLDTSFGGDGIAQDYFGGHGGGFTGVMAQRDGRIVLGGAVPAEDGTNNSLSSLARARVDGSRDPAFDGDGLVQLPLPPRPSDDPTWMQGAHTALQPDGRIAVAAQHIAVVDDGQRARAGWVLARLLGDGSLDQEFGDGGFAFTAFGNSFMRPRTVVSAGRRLVVAGESADCEAIRSALIAFEAEGARTDTVGPAMRVCTGVVRPEPDGDLPVEVQCPVVEEVCRGTETIDVPASELRSDGRRKPRALRVGSRRFEVAGARTATVGVRTTRGFRRLLGERRRLRAVVVFSARDRAGNRRTTRRAIQIRR